MVNVTLSEPSEGFNQIVKSLERNPGYARVMKRETKEFYSKITDYNTTYVDRRNPTPGFLDLIENSSDEERSNLIKATKHMLFLLMEQDELDYYNKTIAKVIDHPEKPVKIMNPWLRQLAVDVPDVRSNYKKLGEKYQFLEDIKALAVKKRSRPNQADANPAEHKKRKG